MVDDGIDGDGGLTSLSITNNKFSLTSTDGDEGVDTLNTSLHRFSDGLSGNNTGSLDFNSGSLGGLEGTETVDGVTEGVQDSTAHSITNGDIDDGTSSLDDITFLNISIVTQNDDTDVVSFQVKGHTSNTGLKFNHFTGLDLSQTKDSCNTITNGNNGTVFSDVVLLGDTLNLFSEDNRGFTSGQFLVGQIHGSSEAEEGSSSESGYSLD